MVAHGGCDTNPAFRAIFVLKSGPSIAPKTTFANKLLTDLANMGLVLSWACHFVKPGRRRRRLKAGRHVGVSIEGHLYAAMAEALEMVQRYTRSVTFEDSLKFYKAPIS